jgi:hypothetical protein
MMRQGHPSSTLTTLEWDPDVKSAPFGTANWHESKRFIKMPCLRDVLTECTWARHLQVLRSLCALATTCRSVVPAVRPLPADTLNVVTDLAGLEADCEPEGMAFDSSVRLTIFPISGMFAGCMQLEDSMCLTMRVLSLTQAIRMGVPAQQSIRIQNNWQALRRRALHEDT